MPQRMWWLIICTILIVILLPLGIDWLIIGNDFPSNISNSDWVGFLGGYIGSIVGAIVSLIGIIVTIRFTKAQLDASQVQYEDQKRMNYIPILDCQISKITEGRDEDAVSIDAEYTLDKQKKLYPVTIIFNIFNIGVGAASDLKYGMELNGVEQDGVFWLLHNRVIRAQESLEQKITIYIPHEKGFKPTIVFFYEDVLGNIYRKTVEIIIEYVEDSESFCFFIMKQDKGKLCKNSVKDKLYYVVKAIKLEKTKDRNS